MLYGRALSIIWVNWQNGWNWLLSIGLMAWYRFFFITFKLFVVCNLLKMVTPQVDSKYTWIVRHALSFILVFGLKIWYAKIRFLTNIYSRNLHADADTLNPYSNKQIHFSLKCRWNTFVNMLNTCRGRISPNIQRFS